MKIKDYSEKSIVIYGDDTKEKKETLKSMGGRFNSHLTIDGERIKGWIFSRTNEKLLYDFVNSGKVTIPTRKMGNGLPPLTQESVRNHFYDWIIKNNLMESVYKSLEEALGIESAIVECDLAGNPTGGKSYKFYGVGCGGSYLKIDGRAKNLKQVYDFVRCAMIHEQRYYDLITEHFGNQVVEKLKSEGCPLTAIYFQDMNVAEIRSNIVMKYLHDAWGFNTQKSVRIITYID